MKEDDADIRSKLKSFLPKIKLLIQTWLLSLSPLWAYLIIRLLVEPVGFWQEVVLAGLGLWILGGLQVIGFIIGVFATFWIIFKEDIDDKTDELQ